MTNAAPVYPPYFGFLREMIRRAETHASRMNSTLADFEQEALTTNDIYEIEALTNVIGELECTRAECERRIRYLEAKISE